LSRLVPERARDERSEIVEHEAETTPLHEGTEKIHPVGARQLALKLVSQAGLAGRVHQQRTLRQRRLGKEHRSERVEGRAGSHRAQMAGPSDAGLARGKRSLSAEFRRSIGERVEETVEDHDTGLLAILRLSPDGREHPLDEWPEMSGDERRSPGYIEVSDIDLSISGQVHKLGESFVEQVVVGAILEPLGHWAMLLEVRTRHTEGDGAGAPGRWRGAAGGASRAAVAPARNGA
jgi:hypothetical protein